MMTVIKDVTRQNPEIFALMANVGDCRAVISDNGVALQITEDHKPQLPQEKERIEAAGGWVHKNRVNGLLAVSRSFGDINYKAVDDNIFTIDTSSAAASASASGAASFSSLSSLSSGGGGNNSKTLEERLASGKKYQASAQQIIEWSRVQQVVGIPEVNLKERNEKKKKRKKKLEIKNI